MLRRVNLLVLLGLIVTLVLSVTILSSAQTGGGSAADALAVGAAEVGKPYAFGTDGPATFSCTGLMRHILRAIGVDSDAPWDHQAYLGKYPTHATPVPGDVVVYPHAVGMYVGDNTVLIANNMDQVVGYYPMDSIGTPLGFANPYGGASDPAPVDPAIPADQTAVDPALVAPAATEPTGLDSALVDPAAIEPTEIDPTWVDPTLVDPAAWDQTTVDPAAWDQTTVDPALADPAAVDPTMA